MGARLVQCAVKRFVFAAETETLRYRQMEPAWLLKTREHRITNKMTEEQIREITRKIGLHKKLSELCLVFLPGNLMQLVMLRGTSGGSVAMRKEPGKHKIKIGL